MTDLATSVTPDMLTTARTGVRAVLQETDPTLDISVGGVVDSVIVEGNVAVAANNQLQVNRAYMFQQLKAISEGTVTVEDSVLDNLMTNYYVTRQADVQSTGLVEYIVQTNQNYVISSGTILRHGDFAYTVDGTYTVYAVGTTGVDTSILTNVLAYAYYDSQTGFVYRFRIPVIAMAPGPDSMRVSGEEFIADAAFAGLGAIRAVSNFTLGTVVESNQALATRALSGILTPVIGGGPDNISKVVAQAYPGALASAVGVESAMQTRGRDNPFGINTGGKLDVYVKSGAIAEKSLLYDAIVTNFATHTAKVTLSQADSIGLYRALVEGYSTTTPPVVVSGGITIVSVTHLAWTGTGFNPELTTDLDRAFSANTQVEVVFTDTRQTGSGYVVSMTSNGQTLSGKYAVNISDMPGVSEAATAIYADAARPPGLDVLVKAAVPCVTTISVTAVKPTNYNGPSASSIAAELAVLINDLPMRLQFLDDFTISNLLKQASSQLLLSSVNMTGLIYGQDGTNISVVQSGNKLTIPTNTTAKVSYETTFFAADAANVTVTLV